MSKLQSVCLRSPVPLVATRQGAVLVIPDRPDRTDSQQLAPAMPRDGRAPAELTRARGNTHARCVSSTFAVLHSEVQGIGRGTQPPSLSASLCRENCDGRPCGCNGLLSRIVSRKNDTRSSRSAIGTDLSHVWPGFLPRTVCARVAHMVRGLNILSLKDLGNS